MRNWGELLMEPKGRAPLGVLGWIFPEGELEGKKMEGGPGNTDRKWGSERREGSQPHQADYCWVQWDTICWAILETV